jgi:hypothetical protein
LEEDAFPRFKAAVDDLYYDATSSGADWTLLRFLSPVIPSMLNKERRQTLTPPSIDALNRYLSSLQDKPPSPSQNRVLIPQSLHNVYTQAEAYSIDGLHYDLEIVQQELNILLNMLCNEKLFDSAKGTTTCCVSGPRPTLKNYIFVLLLLLFGLLSFLVNFLGFF